MKRNANQRRIVELAKEGRLTRHQIAAEVGVTHSHVSLVIKLAGVDLPTEPQLRVAGLVRRLKTECVGMRRTEAAKVLGIRPERVTELDIGNPPRVLADGRRTRASTAPVQRILAIAPDLAAAGWSRTEAAKEFGIPRRVLERVLVWHLPELVWQDGRRRNGRRSGKMRPCDQERQALGRTRTTRT